MTAAFKREQYTLQLVIAIKRTLIRISIASTLSGYFYYTEIFLLVYFNTVSALYNQLHFL